MHEEIGITAGAIWQALNANGEMSLAALKKEVSGKVPVIDWANWVAREDKIVLTRCLHSETGGLKGPDSCCQHICASPCTRVVEWLRGRPPPCLIARPAVYRP
jgi:Winged helix-turn-helix domain (DUF2582)